MGTWGLSHSAEEEWEKAVGQGHVRHARLRHGGKDPQGPGVEDEGFTGRLRKSFTFTETDGPKGRRTQPPV